MSFAAHGKIAFPEPSTEATALADAFAVSMPGDHDFMIVARRRNSPKMYLRSSQGTGDALTLLAVMDAMGGSFRKHAEQIAKEIELDFGRNG